MSQLKVLVSGASIAGPTTAYWLAKAGASVTVIERFPSLRSGGQNVDIRSVGVAVMRKMDGMEAAVRAKLYPIDGFQFVDLNGKPFATMTATGNVDQQSLLSEFEIFRGDLSKILHDLSVEKGVRYVFGESIASMQQQEEKEGPIRVDFNNGRPSEEFDLVVACDGATSRTRAMGLGCGVRDHIHPMNAWAAYFTIKQDLLQGSTIGQSWSSPPGRFSGMGPIREGGNKAILMRILPRNDPNATLPFQQASKASTDNVDALKDLVARDFAGAGYKISEILEGMRNSEDFYASEIVQVKVPTLYKGRFVLVGDAGYAGGPTGTGTSLAMGGAYLLAGELSRCNGDLTAGLKAYEERMKPIIADLQKIPPGIPALLGPQTQWGNWLRNLFFTALSWAMSLGGYFGWLTSLFSSGFGSSEKFPLPNYEWVA